MGVLAARPILRDLRDSLEGLLTVTDRDISDRRLALKSLLKGSLKEYVEARMAESRLSHT